MLESLLNKLMEMKNFWVDRDIVGMSLNLNLWNDLWGLANFLGALFYLLGFRNEYFGTWHFVTISMIG